jgi:hypothetical protein
MSKGAEESSHRWLEHLLALQRGLRADWCEGEQSLDKVLIEYLCEMNAHVQMLTAGCKERQNRGGKNEWHSRLRLDRLRGDVVGISLGVSVFQQRDRPPRAPARVPNGVRLAEPDSRRMIGRPLLGIISHLFQIMPKIAVELQTASAWGFYKNI